MIKKILLTLLLFSSYTLFSQNSLKSVEELGLYLEQNSNQYLNSVIDLKEAKENISPILKVESTSISSSINSSGDIVSTLNLPIINEVQLSADINQDLVGSVGVSINPFTGNREREISHINYNIADIVETKTLGNTQKNGIETVLNYLTIKQRFELEKIEEELNKTLYDDAKNRYKLADITLDDLQDALVEWSDSRVSLLNITQDLHSLENTLLEVLGGDRDIIEGIDITIESLLSSLDLIKSSIDLSSADYLNDKQLLIDKLQLDKSQSEFNAIHAYNANLRAQGGINYNLSTPDEVDYNASITFSISLDDFNIKEKEREKERLLLANKEYTLQQEKAKNLFKQRLNAIDLNEINSETVYIQYEQAKTVLSEAEILFNLGDYSETDYIGAWILFEQAKTSLYTAYASEYLSWLEITKYL